MTEEEKIEQRYEEIRKKLGMPRNTSDSTVRILGHLARMPRIEVKKLIIKMYEGDEEDDK